MLKALLVGLLIKLLVKLLVINFELECFGGNIFYAYFLNIFIMKFYGF
jgi:hypothetical protein